MRRFLALAVLALPMVAFAAAPADVVEQFSGMARVSDTRVLVVNDVKGGRPGARVGLLELGPGGITPLPVTVQGWESEPPSDLESCTPVPGSPGEFLLAESGWFARKYGRVFRIRLEDRAATVLGSFTVRPEEDDTHTRHEIEGISAFSPSEGTVVVVLGERGGPPEPGQAAEPGRLVWGLLEGTDFRPRGEAAFSLDAVVPGGRSCSDLLVVPSDEGFRVWSVAAADPHDTGPFRSAVCDLGCFQGTEFVPAQEPQVLWRLEGLKVEALAPSPAVLRDSLFCVATDDEVYGGIFRPLPRRN